MIIKQGFTLAEVLITLTVIGVIAAITIPSLITNVDLDRKQAEAIIKKTYTSFNDATKQIVMMETTSHTMGSVGCSDSNCIRDLYGKYLSYIKTCNSDAQDNCLDGAPATSENQMNTGGQTTLGTLGLILQDVFSLPAYATPTINLLATDINFTSKSLAVLADGTLVGFSYDNTCKTTVSSVIEYEQAPVNISNSCIAITVDVNGPKKPNTVGRDRYQFAIGKLGVKFKAAHIRDSDYP